MSTARDPGLQPERTRLAWRRTFVAMLICSVLLVREAIRSVSPIVLTVALCSLSSLCFLWAASWRRNRLLESAARTAPSSPLMLSTCLAAVCLAALFLWQSAVVWVETLR